MVQDILLEPPQEKLLGFLVEQSRGARERRQFDVRKMDADKPRIFHTDPNTALDIPFPVYQGDFGILSEAGLLTTLDRPSNGRILFDVAPKRFAYYEQRIVSAPRSERTAARDVGLLSTALRGILDVREVIDDVEITDPEREIIRTLLGQLLTDVEEDLEASAESEAIWDEARPRMPDRVTVLEHARDALAQLERTKPIAWKIGSLITQIKAGFDLLELLTK